MLALLLGIALALWCVPLPLLLGRLPSDPTGMWYDFMIHVTGQQYFLRQPWHWPLLRIDKLVTPGGTSIALTDSIPLEALLLKLFHPLFPQMRQGISLWQALTWVLQPVAAVFALRGAGEKRIGPALAIAVMAMSMPSMLARLWHAALSSHFLLLFGLGLYFRATRPGADWRPLVWFGLLCVTAFLIHPYLMIMDAGLFFAVPLTLLFRRAPETRNAFIALALTAAAIVGLGRLLDYRGSSGGNGFGYFSMNLLSPIWPAQSGLVPGVSSRAIDATGGQSLEGFQYLGAGLILALLIAIATPTGRFAIRGFAARHRGLLYVSIALTAFALSNFVTCGKALLFALPDIYPGAGALRSSGRLFWPVTYLLLVGSVLLVARLRPRLAAGALTLCAALQFADAQPLRLQDHRQQLAATAPAKAGFARLDDLLGRYRSVVIAPRFECQHDLSKDITPIIYLAALHDMSTNSAYTARITPENACGAPGTNDGGVLAADQIGVAIGMAGSRTAQSWLARQARCARLDDMILCSLSGAGLDGLPRFGAAPPDRTTGADAHPAITLSRPFTKGA